MSASLDLLAGVAAANATTSNAPAAAEPLPLPSVPNTHPAATTSRVRESGVRKPRRSKTPPPIVEGSEADSKRALRAERNRQSAAASRDRKKQHLRELENRVRYLSDTTAMLQYKAHVESKEWREKEAKYEAENTRLNTALSAALAENEKLRTQLHNMQAGSPVSKTTAKQ